MELFAAFALSFDIFMFEEHAVIAKVSNKESNLSFVSFK
jgi:hypothetical protein